eukprot:5588087-Prymnesium_polylepis.1
MLRLTALVLSLTAIVSSSWREAASATSEAAPPGEGVIKFTRLWVSSDGATHIKDCSVQGLKRSGSFGTPQYVRDMLGDLRPTDLVFTQQTGANPWHPCPSPQLVVTLAGSWYVNTTDGDSVVFRPGDVLYQDDSRGLTVAGNQPSHFSGAVGGPCNQLVISVAKSPVLDDVSCDWLNASGAR